jgi:AcrR family transcriptional regulator
VNGTPRRPAEDGKRKRALRSDAIRNTERLLEAARELFDEKGAAVTMDEIAQQARVGNATMYRRFPSRSDLLAAVYSDQLSALCGYGAQLLDATDPAEAMFKWLAAFVDHLADKRELAMAATEGDELQRGEMFRRWHDSMITAAAGLLRRAQEVGAVREEVTAVDVLVLANAMVLASSDAGQAHRMLRYVRDGIVSR